LKIAPGARAVGMGEAFVATADDATALYWNPAGIIQMKGNQITYMHNFWFQGVTYSYLGYVQGFKSTEDEKFGVSIIMVNGGEIQRTLEDASGNYTGTGGNFTSYDLALALSYAWKLGEKYNFGISFKFIRSNIDDVTGYAVAADFGFLFSPIDRLNIGVNAQNAIIPVPIKYYREYTAVSAAHTLPMNIKVGAAYKLSDNVNLSLDVNFPIDNNPNFHFGAEYWYGNLAFRAGYKTDFIAGIDLLSGLTAGLGFKWKNYEADYAFVPYGDLGFTHRISLSVKF
jgi:long-subunit fatty acid transport protein